jgi:hypothetical protein
LIYEPDICPKKPKALSQIVDILAGTGAEHLQVQIFSVLRLVGTAEISSSPILVTLMGMRYIPPKRRLLQEPHGVTPQKRAFFTSLFLNAI